MLLQTKPFCLAPWACIHTTPDGLVYPCCMSTFSKDNAYGDLNKDSLKNILNSSNAKEFRKLMMSNEPHKACAHCVMEEKSGITSYRHFWNTRYKFIEEKIKETREDGYYNFTTFPYIDIRISNLCNFKCRMCHSNLSSSWMMEDLKKLGTYKNVSQTILEVPKKQELLNFIFEHAKSIREIEFAGGEPFLIKEYFEIIDQFKLQKNYKVRIRFHTNGSTLFCKGRYIPELLKPFKNILIMCSVDGYNKVNDYSRSGSVYRKIVNNFKILRKSLPNADIILVPTVSIPTVYSLPFLYLDFIKNKIVSYNSISLRPLYGPLYLNIQTLEVKEKIKLLNYLKYFVNEMDKKLNSNFFKKIINKKNFIKLEKEFASIINFLFNKNYTFDRKSFSENILYYDKQRNENYSDICPETSHLAYNKHELNINTSYIKLKNFIDNL